MEIMDLGTMFTADFQANQAKALWTIRYDRNVCGFENEM
jgi:hypothetical protein